MTTSDFEVIYRTHAKTVYYFLMSLCHDESLSEELAQETMFRAVMNISSLRDDSKALIWLCRIAKNLYFEHLKKRKRLVSLDDSPDSTISSPEDVAAELETKDTAGRILEIAISLEEPYREVFLMHAISELPLKDISRRFGKSESWARVTYYRAKAKIISLLEDKSND